MYATPCTVDPYANEHDNEGAPGSYGGKANKQKRWRYQFLLCRETAMTSCSHSHVQQPQPGRPRTLEPRKLQRVPRRCSLRGCFVCYQTMYPFNEKYGMYKHQLSANLAKVKLDDVYPVSNAYLCTLESLQEAIVSARHCCFSIRWAQRQTLLNHPQPSPTNWR